MKLSVHTHKPRHSKKKRTPRLPFNSGRIISESKHAKDAVKISGDETDICQASEPVILPDGQESAGGGECTCVFGWIECSIIQCFQPVSIHAWLGDLSHLSLIALPGTCRLSLQCPLLLFDPLLSEKDVHPARSLIALFFHASPGISSKRFAMGVTATTLSLRGAVVEIRRRSHCNILI